jgi:hypothetical protein
VWRNILKSIGPEPPRRAKAGDGVMLGVCVLLILTAGLPYLLGILF